MASRRAKRVSHIKLSCTFPGQPNPFVSNYLLFGPHSIPTLPRLSLIPHRVSVRAITLIFATTQLGRKDTNIPVHPILLFSLGPHIVPFGIACLGPGRKGHHSHPFHFQISFYFNFWSCRSKIKLQIYQNLNCKNNITSPCGSPLCPPTTSPPMSVK